MENKNGAYHHENLKQALMDAALAYITEKGATAFTIREVARQVGVSHTAPYRHYLTDGFAAQDGSISYIFWIKRAQLCRNVNHRIPKSDRSPFRRVTTNIHSEVHIARASKCYKFEIILDATVVSG